MLRARAVPPLCSDPTPPLFRSLLAVAAREGAQPFQPPPKGEDARAWLDAFMCALCWDSQQAGHGKLCIAHRRRMHSSSSCCPPLPLPPVRSNTSSTCMAMRTLAMQSQSLLCPLCRSRSACSRWPPLRTQCHSGVLTKLRRQRHPRQQHQRRQQQQPVRRRPPAQHWCATPLRRAAAALSQARCHRHCRHQPSAPACEPAPPMESWAAAGRCTEWMI